MKSSRSAAANRPLASAAAVVGLSLVTCGAAPIASAARAAADTRWGADHFPNVTLTTHEGKTVRFFDDLIKGKIVAINLIYTTCQFACPLETARLAQVQRLIGDRMGRDVFFYSITIDPDHDTPAVLDEYARKFHAGPGWLFLTGSKADIDLVSRKTGLYAAPDPNDPDGHLPFLLVGNQATGQWMRNSAVDNPKFLARTIGDWLNDWQTANKTALRSYSESPALAFDLGQYTFGYHCAACHTIGGGSLIGPDLDGVTARRNRDWLRSFIAEPDRMNADGDPIAVSLRNSYGKARMPNLDLSDEDVLAVIDYLRDRSRTLHDAAVESPQRQGGPPSVDSGREGAVLESYLRIQQALFTDTRDSIQADALKLEAEAAALGAAGEPIRSAAAALRQAGDLHASREAFAILSDRVIALTRSAAPASGLVVAYCPMAQKYWLQKGERLRNPYYGKAMPECGRLVETGKAER